MLVFTSTRPQLHSSYINPEDAGRLRQLMRMNYETMHLFGMSRAERTRCLTTINDYYSLHLPDFPVLKSFRSVERTCLISSFRLIGTDLVDERSRDTMCLFPALFILDTDIDGLSWLW